MLPKKYRLTKKTEFQKVLRKGKVLQGKFAGVAYLFAKGGDVKVGFIVSNKISKKATERNRARRILREAAREGLGEVPQGTYLVFLAKKAIVEASPQDLKKEAKRLLEKIKKDG